MSVPSSASLTAGISVVVPVYNSARILPDLVERLEPVLSATGGPFELILVNDGSRDESWEIIGRLVARLFCGFVRTKSGWISTSWHHDPVIHFRGTF